MSSFVTRIAALVGVLVLASLARAAELPIIAKARAFAGTESALNAIETVHYSGTLVTADPADATKQTVAQIEIVMQKPDRQRVTIKSDKTIESTALDGYEGWTRVAAADDPTKWQQTLLGADGVKRLRANTWENLAFFRGLEREGGSVEDKGTTTVDGVRCQKVAFVHSPTIVFTRYFDVTTGKVVLTETEAGGTIREKGEVVVNGVRFPHAVVTTTQNQAGQDQSVTITFDKITLNEALPVGYFAVPPLKNR